MNATSPGSRLLGPGDVRALAQELDLRPTKRRGQNFVTDPNTIRRIVRAAELAPDETVLEIGPGLGSLTLGLLEAASRVVAVEIDVRLAQALPATVARIDPSAVDRLSVRTLDALTLEPGSLPGASGSDSGVPGLPTAPPTALVANLPYNVAVPALLRVFERLPSVRHGVVMVQLEVAERLAAQPGSKAYGVPSAKAAWYADVRQAGVVPRTVFWPAPNVDSGLVTFTRREPPTGPIGERAPRRERVFAVVDAAFAMRRKMLRGSLAGLAGSSGAAETALRAADVDPRERGERLDIAAFTRIAAHLPDPAPAPEEAP